MSLDRVICIRGSVLTPAQALECPLATSWITVPAPIERVITWSFSRREAFARRSSEPRFILFVSRNDLIFSVASAIIGDHSLFLSANQHWIFNVLLFDFNLTKQTPVGFHRSPLSERSLGLVECRNKLYNFCRSNQTFFFKPLVKRKTYKVIKHTMHTQACVRLVIYRFDNLLLTRVYIFA